MKTYKPIVVAILICFVASLLPSAADEPATPAADQAPAASPGTEVRSASGLEQIVCPGTGGCCTSHSTPGCDDLLCCDVVCNRMPFCCEGLWSTACANIAVQVCGVCEPPFVCPQPGACCVGRMFSAGCERSGCCHTVCTFDSYCCTGEWDDICARKARENCLNVCACPSFGNFDADPAIDLRDAAAFLNCFSGDGSSPVPSSCACADYDGDGDADLQDFRVLTDLLQSP